MVANAIYASNYLQSCHNNVIFHQLSTEAAVKVRKSCSENMQQITGVYRCRSVISKVVKQLY